MLVPAISRERPLIHVLVIEAGPSWKSKVFDGQDIAEESRRLFVVDFELTLVACNRAVRELCETGSGLWELPETCRLACWNSSQVFWMFHENCDLSASPFASLGHIDGPQREVDEFIAFIEPAPIGFGL